MVRRRYLDAKNSTMTTILLETLLVEQNQWKSNVNQNASFDAGSCEELESELEFFGILLASQELIKIDSSKNMSSPAGSMPWIQVCA